MRPPPLLLACCFCCAFFSSGLVFFSRCAFFSSCLVFFSCCAAGLSSCFADLAGCAFFSSWAGLAFCSSCWSCCSWANAGDAAPRAKDRIAVLITPTSFILGCCLHYRFVAYLSFYCKLPVVTLTGLPMASPDTRSSTLRFCCRPEELSFEATGKVLPKPLDDTEFVNTPCCTR